jgi:integrase/recombinase XerD
MTIIDQRGAVTFESKMHRNNHCIFIKYKFNNQITNRLKQITKPKWSSTYKAWYVIDTEANRIALQLPLVTHTEYTVQKFNPEKEQIKTDLKNEQSILTLIYKSKNIAECNQMVLAETLQLLNLKGYATTTKRTYINELAHFLSDIKNKPAVALTITDIKKYFNYLIDKINLKEATIHSRMNALKFYYEKVCDQPQFFITLPRPKKHLQLPKVLSEEKILEVIMSIGNLKHKAIVMMGYSAGLRVSEVVKLRWVDIDFDRMTIFIEKGKNKKDRIVPLAASMYYLLLQYKKMYQTTYWIFDGQLNGTNYSVRSAEQVFRKACELLQLPPHLSFHKLRHSYATHLLENGTDISYIQKLLGHNDVRTTLIYAKVALPNLIAVESPLDKLLRKKGLSNLDM